MQFGRLKRRDFITLAGGAAVAWPLAAPAQQAGRMRRIGVLITGVESNAQSRSQMNAFIEGMERLGWVDGRTIKIDYRWGESADRLRAHAKEFAGAGLDAIFAGNASSLIQLNELIKTVPIIFANVPDPVHYGFVTSVSRPGGNVTGFANYEASIGAKWFELLKQIAPRVTRVAFNHDPSNPATIGYLRAIEAAASSMNVSVSAVTVRTSDEIERAVEIFSREPNGGMIVPPGPTITAYRSLITELAARYRLPAVYPFREDVQGGGLTSYGIDAPDLFRRAASYVDRILKGERPGDLPVQYATTFHLAVNLKTAKALGLDLPVSLLARVDEVIE